MYAITVADRRNRTYLCAELRFGVVASLHGPIKGRLEVHHVDTIRRNHEAVNASLGRREIRS
jgi:hypothetical protein